jgi:hypothetical protein
VTVPTAGSCGVAKERMETKKRNVLLRLVLLYEKLSKEAIKNALLKGLPSHPNPFKESRFDLKRDFLRLFCIFVGSVNDNEKQVIL